LASAPWFLFAGSAYLDANGPQQIPEDLCNSASLFMMRSGLAPVWRLRRLSDATGEVVIPLTLRLLCDDMITLKQPAITGTGFVAPPGDVCREDVQVARLGSFSTAARECGLSQSQASRIVADLEADLGVRLL
jgi:DNA-binding transcriptional LysR family regulator